MIINCKLCILEFQLLNTKRRVLRLINVFCRFSENISQYFSVTIFTYETGHIVVLVTLIHVLHINEVSQVASNNARCRVLHCPKSKQSSALLHILSYNVWETRNGEVEEGKKRRKQFVSSCVKLDKLSLRDVVFNVVVVRDIRDYTQTQLNINNLCAVWLAAMLNNVLARSMSAVFVCMRIGLLLITVRNLWPSLGQTVCIAVSHLEGLGFKPLHTNQLLKKSLLCAGKYGESFFKIGRPHFPHLIPNSAFSIMLYFEPALTLNIPSLGRQRCLPSWGTWRTPCFFCNFSTLWCGKLLKLCFFGFWNYNSVLQALLVSNILCLFISTEVSQ